MTSHRATRLAALLIGALTLAGCTGSGSSPAPVTSSRATPAAAGVARPIDFTAPKVAGGSAVHPDQYLDAVAARGAAVVAVGVDSSDNIARPLFLTSTDSGVHWNRSGPGSAGSPGRSDDEYATGIATGAKGFLAMGYADDIPQLWLSATGKDWQRVSAPKGVFTAEDDVEAATYTSSGWVVVGTHDGAVGAGLADVIVWTSPDQQSWTRHALSTSGVRFPAGTASVADVAAIGRTWVIAGGIEDDASTRQPDRIAVWRSTDAGVHWTQATTAADLGGDYRAYADQLSVSGGHFALLAQGSLTDDKGRWDAVLLTGDATAARWKNGSTLGGWNTKADEYPAGTVYTGRQWVTYGSVGQSPSDARITVGSRLDSGRPLPGSGLGGVRDQHANGAAVVGGDVIVVGSSAASGSDSPMIWRVSGSAVSPVAVPAAATAGRPWVSVGGVVQDGSGYLAAGTASSEAVSWSSGDGRTWQGEELPGRSAAVDSIGVSDLEVTGDGTALISGTVRPARGSRAAVWIKKPTDANWRAVTSSTFVSPVKDNYGFYTTSALVAGPGGIVLAGAHWANGHQDLAFWFSADGTTWHHGTGTTQTYVSDSDKDNNRSPWKGFRAPVNGSIGVDAVRSVGSGFVAVGSITTAGRSRVAVWRSDDGLVWSDPDVLDQPDGIYSAGNARLVAGQQLVLTAIGHRTAGDQGRLISWVSSTGGFGWQRGTPVEEPSDVFDVISVPGGYLAAGEVGPADNEDAAAWTSLDGQAWKRTSLSLPRATGDRHPVHQQPHRPW